MANNKITNNLHYSQTGAADTIQLSQFGYHWRLHYSQTGLGTTSAILLFEYHWKLHYSQTCTEPLSLEAVWVPLKITLLSNHERGRNRRQRVWVPLKITLLSNSRKTLTILQIVWVPLKITLLSNDVDTNKDASRSLSTIEDYTTLKRATIKCRR